jgi:DnaD/phage-associated family protein
MMSFQGFDPRLPSVPVPAEVFSEIVPSLEDPAEIKVLLAAIHALAAGAPFVTELSLRPALPDMDIGRLLDRAVDRRILATRDVPVDGRRQRAWTWTYPASVTALEDYAASGVSHLGDDLEAVPLRQRDSIFDHYENNLGMLTSSIAERIKDALSTYPEHWVREAIDEAAVQNKRSWAYTEAILRRWSQEGRSDGEPEGHPEPGGDATERFGGRFSHLFRQA